MWLNRFKALPRPLRMLVLASFINRAGMFVFPLLAVYLVQSRHLGAGEAGVLISVGSTGLLVGSLLSGPVCGRAGRRAALVSSLLLNAAGYLGLAVLDGPPWTYAAMLFVALVGMGMFAPAANTLIADLAEPDQRPFAYTVSYIANNLGMGVGPLLGGLAAAYSYQLMFAGDILLGLIAAATIRICVPADTRRGAAVSTATTRRAGLLRDFDVAVLVLVSFCYVAPLIGLEYTLPLAVTTVLHSSVAVVGAVYTINSLVVVSVGMLIEKRIKAYPTRTLLITAGLLWSTGMAILVVGFSLPAVLLSTAVWTVGEIIASVVVPTYIADHVEERRVGSFMALNGFVLSAARLVVPMGLGFVWQAHGHRPVLLLLLLTPVVGVVAFAALRVRPTARPLPAAAEPATARP
ncbi:Predicted arabinose efflux permease, MFS family [Micromonospora purpureochromogenes]|uniref:Predicted arabinose efflux permease, MFS family n=1 Tax=Micromonospora purpureochromogenes TaxID=47872 RepID=A0A1C4V0N8_9ACTN|nr:MFS transporter [Micromonospora purpureochromogenes]SCE77483.1 Predicted arabinose efflux permease, MFS family [Micromonospora purpureochromogenes]